MNNNKCKKDCNGKIYVVTHKIYQLSNLLISQGYQLITVGNKCKNIGERDDLGDNIADKNANFCELTALYWLWKNKKDNEYKGICHYRRYLTKATISRKEKYYLTKKDIYKILFVQNYDIILPQKEYFIRPSLENYKKCGFQKDIDITRQVIKEMYPDYVESFDQTINANYSYLCNIMVASDKVFDSYCKWLFDILFEVENRVDISQYSVQEARIFGFLSERLLGVWVKKNNLNVKEYRSINIDLKPTIGYIFKLISSRVHVYQIVKTIIWKLRKVFN